jgi:hypothetical protein
VHDDTAVLLRAVDYLLEVRGVVHAEDGSVRSVAFPDPTG